MLAEVAMLQKTVSQLGERMERLEERASMAKEETERYIDRRIADHFKEKMAYNADIIGEVDEDAWQDWVAPA